MQNVTQLTKIFLTNSFLIKVPELMLWTAVAVEMVVVAGGAVVRYPALGWLCWVAGLSDRL